MCVNDALRIDDLWMPNLRNSRSFLGFRAIFWMSVGVVGRLWSWDGWPPSCLPKRLISRVFMTSLDVASLLFTPLCQGRYGIIPYDILDGASR